MTDNLEGPELVELVQRVFSPGHKDNAMAFLVDLPDPELEDNEQWRLRREMVLEWASALAPLTDTLGMNVHLYLYRNTRTNNADLPEGAWAHRFGHLPVNADDLDPEIMEPFDSIFRSHTIFIAPTELSCTAPLKLKASGYGFRAATMPGFQMNMIDSLRLDYVEINRRVNLLARLLDSAEEALIDFVVDGENSHRLILDLRNRGAHASGGLFPEAGTAGNLPSGEAYIVPYEGEEDYSRSSGVLPVQFGEEVVLYSIDENRAVMVQGEGAAAVAEREKLIQEPAYGNLAELGLGVLGDFGIEPTGVILLDEKLGLHIAFGRSDHFGGTVGADDFSRPEAVVHIDRVYIPQTQPGISLKRAVLKDSEGGITEIIRDDAYVVDFAGGA